MTALGLEGVALVTGASGTLGAAVARRLDEAGMSVALHYQTNRDAAEVVAKELRNPSCVVQADVCDWEAVKAMEATVNDTLGPVAVLVTCSAVRYDGLMATQGVGDWSRTIEVNLVGTFHVCRAVVPGMLVRRHGRIVNVVSPAGMRGSPGQTAYSASKAGVIGMTRSLAVECARRKVTANAVAPGYFRSSLTDALLPEQEQRILEFVPLRRPAEPAEIADAIACVAANPYMTGQVVAVDGGLSA